MVHGGWKHGPCGSRDLARARHCVQLPEPRIATGPVDRSGSGSEVLRPNSSKFTPQTTPRGMQGCSILGETALLSRMLPDRWNAATFPNLRKLCVYRWMGPATAPPKCIGKKPAMIEIVSGTKATCAEPPPMSRAPRVSKAFGVTFACSAFTASHSNADSSSPLRMRACSFRRKPKGQEVLLRTELTRSITAAAASELFIRRMPAVAPRYSGMLCILTLLSCEMMSLFANWKSGSK
mmetsp:Transcript_18833/g.49748  ORF Transcript_18833/g.49748 Transcript_18833/m.49748 type:complete len:236 (-) Transcript_18833:443-1150(-)